MALFVVYLLTGLLMQLEVLWPSALWPVVALALLVAGVARLLAAHRVTVVCLATVLWAKIQLVVSLAVIAAGVYMPEVGRYGTGPVHAGYFVLLTLLALHAAGLTARALVGAPHGIVREPSETLRFVYRTVAVASAGVTCAVLLQTGFASGFPLLTGTDRFAFGSTAGGLYAIAINYKGVCAGMLGFAASRACTTIRHKRLVLLALLAVAGTSILFGEKFGSLIFIFIFFMLPALVAKDPHEALVSPALAVGAVALVTLALGLTYFIYSDYGILPADLTLERMFGRFASGGQIWYATMLDPIGLLRVDAALLDGTRALLLSDNAAAESFQTAQGIFYFIAKLAPDNVYRNILTGGGAVQFTGAAEAYLITLFGHLGGSLMLVALGAFGGLLAAYYWTALRAGSFLGTAVATMLVHIFTGVSAQGSLWQLFGLAAVVSLSKYVLLDAAGRLAARFVRSATVPPGPILRPV